MYSRELEKSLPITRDFHNLSMPRSEYKRKRARIAYEPFRERKRKCDGAEPCDTCSQWDYECYYASLPRRRRHTTPEKPPKEPNQALKSLEQNDLPDTHGVDRRLEANSGAAFVRKMELNIDPAKAPKLSLFGWNIGKQQLSSTFQGVHPALSITDITSLEHVRTLDLVYIVQAQFFERLEARWESPLTEWPPLTDC